MNKFLLALTLLTVGAGAFHAAQRRSDQLQHRVQAAHESWQAHTQQLTEAQSEQTALTERVRELKQTLAQSRAGAGSALWSALQTNRADRLPRELRRQTLAELGFDWRTSPDFVVVSKRTVRDVGMLSIRDGQLTEAAVGVLALTPGERAQIAAACEQVKADLTAWLLAHLERKEPSGEVLAHYTLPKDPELSKAITNAFTTALIAAVGRERAELIVPEARNWMSSIGVFDRDNKPAMIRVTRNVTGGEVRLSTETSYDDSAVGTASRQLDKSSDVPYPRNFHFIFPNGWEDVAKREGFELPPPPPPRRKKP